MHKCVAAWYLCVFAAGVGNVASAQCTGYASIDLRSFFIATAPGPHNPGQDPRAAFTFRRGSVDGPLLDGADYPFGDGAWWSSPGHKHSIPAFGPVFSHIDAMNQAIWDRRPSYPGVLAQPGNAEGTDDLFLVLRAPGPVSLVRFSGSTQVLGDLSNGVTVQINGRFADKDAALVEPFLVPYTPSGQMPFSIPLAELPIHFAIGDTFYVRIGNNGTPVEDWLNFSMLFSFAGVPLIKSQPVPSPVCVGAEATMWVEAYASITTTYQWQQEVGGEFVNLSDGPQSTGAVVSGSQDTTLHIADTAETEDTLYRCVMTNGCGTTTSTPVRLSVCGQDFNCDGFVNGADFDEFVVSFEIGENRADFDQDGFITGTDYDLYVQAFEEGC